MKITVLSVGRIKEKFYTAAIEEYVKRLGRYCDMQIVEVKDENTPALAGEGEINRILSLEGERLLSKLSSAPEQGSRYVIALDIKGCKMSSEAFANKLSALMTEGRSHIWFVIGGSLGLSPRVLDAADMRLSFSDMTFPHQLMRVILTEQIYRCFRIINNEPYHK